MSEQLSDQWDEMLKAAGSEMLAGRPDPAKFYSEWTVAMDAISEVAQAAQIAAGKGTGVHPRIWGMAGVEAMIAAWPAIWAEATAHLR